MSSERDNNRTSRTDFGFGEIMASADFERFPVWYADRCLLPNGAEKPLRAAETTRYAIEDTFSRQAA